MFVEITKQANYLQEYRYFINIAGTGRNYIALAGVKVSPLVFKVSKKPIAIDSDYCFHYFVGGRKICIQVWFLHNILLVISILSSHDNDIDLGPDYSEFAHLTLGFSVAPSVHLIWTRNHAITMDFST